MRGKLLPRRRTMVYTTMPTLGDVVKLYDELWFVVAVNFSTREYTLERGPY